jgi:hypothetical protein
MWFEICYPTVRSWWGESRLALSSWWPVASQAGASWSSGWHLCRWDINGIRSPHPWPYQAGRIRRWRGCHCQNQEVDLASSTTETSLAREKEDGREERTRDRRSPSRSKQFPYPYRAVPAAALAHESTTFLAQRALAEANPARARSALDIDGDQRAAPPARRTTTWGSHHRI